MVIVLLASLITFPFQMTKVVATAEAENESDTAAATVAAASITNNTTTQASSSSGTNQSTIPEAAKGPTILSEKDYLKRLGEVFIG
jgi:hypothetical protein